MKNRFIQHLPLFWVLALSILFTQAQAQKDFYDVSTIQNIEVKFEQENWRYILDSLRFNGDAVLIGDVVVNGQSIEDAGVRYRATRSFQPGGSRNGLDILLNHVDANTNYQGYSAIKLSSALRDPSMVREVLGYEIAGQYMPAPKANYARVTINGKLYGLFVNVEAVDEGFVKRHFNETGGVMYRSAPKTDVKAQEGCRSNIFGSLQVDQSADCYRQNYELVMGFGFDPLLGLAKMLNEKPDDIASVLHVDRTLWMLAFNNAALNLNSYTGQFSSNYFLYRGKSGQFTPILWDLNLGFGSYKNTGVGSDLKLSSVIQLDPLLHSGNNERPLISKLLSNDLYKKMYLSHLMTINNDYLANEKYLNRAKELQQLIRQELTKDINWASFYTMAEFDQSLKMTIGKKSKIPGLAEVMTPRAEFLKKHPELNALPPSISDITIKHREKLSAVMVNTFKIQAKVGEFPKRVKIFYRFSSEEMFREALMNDDGKSSDETANDGIFSIDIPPYRDARAIEFYIMAENARMVTYNPSRYMYELHKTNLDELNQ